MHSHLYFTPSLPSAPFQHYQLFSIVVRVVLIQSIVQVGLVVLLFPFPCTISLCVLFPPFVLVLHVE